MWDAARRILTDSVNIFLDKNAASRGAAIAFYSVTALAPVLVIVVAVAGLAFGEDAARGAIAAELEDIMGREGAVLLEAFLAGAADTRAGIIAAGVSLVALVLIASGVFVELQYALNDIWDAKPKGGLFVRLVRGRVTSLGLVIGIGFLLLVSLVVDAGVAALRGPIDEHVPYGGAMLAAANFLVAFALIAVLFAMIYRVLPETTIEWRDVTAGAVGTALLFEAGKFLIGLYLGERGFASSYGAAGSLLALLLWIYYSAMIFLYGAAVTRAYADWRRSPRPSTGSG